MEYLSTYRSIFLLGFSTTGKSTIGKILAERLDWRWLDMDNEIQKKSNKTIAEITNNGKVWEYFRKLETDLLKDLIPEKNIVVSCGGGVGVNTLGTDSENLTMNKIRFETYGQLQKYLLSSDKHILIVVLTGDLDILIDRHRTMYIDHTGDHRISLAGKNEGIDKLLEERKQLFNERKYAYLDLSQNQINTTSQPINKSIEQIINLLQNNQ